MRSLSLAVILTLTVSAPAAAQIYSWQDAQGILVVSSRPRTDLGAMKIYQVPGARQVRATAAVAPWRAANTRFDAYIQQHANRTGLSMDLVRAVIQVESAFNPNALSPKGAMGLMQLMPDTAAELGVTDPFQPEQNIRGGVTYLKRLMDRYSANVELALAAYNAGPGSVDRYARTVPPYRETQAYVKRITGFTAAVTPPPAPKPVIYKWMEIVDGRPQARYSNKPPVELAYETLGQR